MIKVGKGPHHRSCWLRDSTVVSPLVEQPSTTTGTLRLLRPQLPGAGDGLVWNDPSIFQASPTCGWEWIFVQQPTIGANREVGKAKEMSECLSAWRDSWMPKTTSSQTWMQLKMPSLQLRAWVLPIAHHSGHQSVHSRIWRR